MRRWAPGRRGRSIQRLGTVGPGLIPKEVKPSGLEPQGSLNRNGWTPTGLPSPAIPAPLHSRLPPAPPHLHGDAACVRVPCQGPRRVCAVSVQQVTRLPLAVVGSRLWELARRGVDKRTFGAAHGGLSASFGCQLLSELSFLLLLLDKSGSCFEVDPRVTLRKASTRDEVPVWRPTLRVLTSRFPREHLQVLLDSRGVRAHP